MINGVTLKVNVDDYILNTLKEDITSEDVSTNAVMPEDKQGKAELICKQDGIICGLGIFERTFELLDKTARFEAYFKDGDEVKKGELLGVIYGDIKAILSGERTGLNYLQRMSGIATMTREYMKELEGTNTTLLDTRKTTPNMRPFEKYAVKIVIVVLAGMGKNTVKISSAFSYDGGEPDYLRASPDDYQEFESSVVFKFYIGIISFVFHYLPPLFP